MNKKNTRNIVLLKNIGLCLGIVLFQNISVLAQSLKIDGVYQGGNIYIYNPTNGESTCITSVSVNGNKMNFPIASNSFEVNFSSLEMKKGDKVSIEILYNEGCKPRIANPEAIYIKSTFTLMALKVDIKTSKLTFTTTGETGILPFVVEQYRWGKWLKIGEVAGNGASTTNSYQLQVNLCSGENQFRVKQVDYSNVPKISKIFKIRNTSPAVTFTPIKKISDVIKFSDVTMYELYDANGVLKAKGTSNQIDLSGFPKSDKMKYVLLYDNQELEFVKE